MMDDAVHRVRPACTFRCTGTRQCSPFPCTLRYLYMSVLPIAVHTMYISLSPPPPLRTTIRYTFIHMPFHSLPCTSTLMTSPPPHTQHTHIQYIHQHTQYPHPVHTHTHTIQYALITHSAHPPPNNSSPISPRVSKLTPSFP